MQIKIEGTAEEVAMALRFLTQPDNGHGKHVTVNNFMPEDSTGTICKPWQVATAGAGTKPV